MYYLFLLDLAHGNWHLWKTSRVKAELDDWIRDHPNAIAYTTGW